MKYVPILMALILTNCVTTEQTMSVDGLVFNQSNGTTIIVGNLSTDEDIYPGDFKDGPNIDFINYPEMAQRAGIEGTVQLFVDISETGAVTDAKVTRGIGGGCDETAWQMIKNSEYTPAKNANLNAIAARHYISIIFKK